MVYMTATRCREDIRGLGGCVSNWATSELNICMNFTKFTSFYDQLAVIQFIRASSRLLRLALYRFIAHVFRLSLTSFHSKVKHSRFFFLRNKVIFLSVKPTICHVQCSEATLNSFSSLMLGQQTFIATVADVK